MVRILHDNPIDDVLVRRYEFLYARSATSLRSARLPLGNHAILLLITGTFAVQMLLDPGRQYLHCLILEKWSVLGLLGHMWLHMTAVHLVGNLVTLWIFGYYVCPQLGNGMYVLAYTVTGAAAGSVHVLYDGRPVIGASGAIMGVLGIYVVICFRQLGWLGPWLILIWFLATLGAALLGNPAAAYMEHIGGFLSGMVLALCFLLCGITGSDQTDPALSAVLCRP